MDYLTDGFPELLRVVLASDVRELEIQEGELRVRLHRAASSENAGAPAPAQPDLEPDFAAPSTTLVLASQVGTFYRAGQPGMAPLVSEGAYVEHTTVIGIIEALHVLTDVEAQCRGVVTAVLATDGQPVEYNQPLIEVLLDG